MAIPEKKAVMCGDEETDDSYDETQKSLSTCGASPKLANAGIELSLIVKKIRHRLQGSPIHVLHH